MAKGGRDLWRTRGSRRGSAPRPRLGVPCRPAAGARGADPPICGRGQRRRRGGGGSPPPPASLDGEEAIETPEDRGVDPDFVARNREGGEGPVSGSMTAAIGIYKGWISPLLPPACRFLPTCSQYGVQAIQEFGPTRGALLTAWRLLRCSPLGGKGYDPPRWPPVAYTYSSY